MSKTIRPRKPLIAFLISLFMPGLGQLYNGSVNKASWFLMAFAFTSITGVLIAALYLPSEWTVPVLLTSTFLGFFIWVYSLLEATFDAKHKKEYTPLQWQGGGVYLLVFVVFSVISLPLLTQYIKDHYVEAYRIPSGSMEPTLVAGDFIFADKRYNCSGCKTSVQRGDIVVFTYPNNRNTNYIKRIIGLPGDRVQIRGENLKINGKTISKTTQQQAELNIAEETSSDNRWLVVWKKVKNATKAPIYDITVPPGHMFVLGDNRNASNDSRFFDTVPLQDIKGKARQIWFSYNRKLGGLRMDRAGKLLHQEK